MIVNNHFNFRRITRCYIVFLSFRKLKILYRFNQKRRGTETTKRNCDTTQRLAEINPVSVGGGVGVGEGADALFLSCCSTETHDTSGNNDLWSIIYTAEAKRLGQSKGSLVAPYTVWGTAIAVTVYGIFGGWIADNGCIHMGAEFSKLWFTFRAMIKCWVSTMAIFVQWKSNSQSPLTA